MDGAGKAAPALPLLLLLLAWLAGAACATGTDAARLAFPGVRLGMTPDAVAAALAARGDATPASTLRRPDVSDVSRKRTYVQRMFHDLRDGRVLQVVFSDPRSGNRAVEITLGDPGATDGAALRIEAERLYGPPTAALPIDGGRGFIAAWNGTAEAEGAIRPVPGAATTLRLEFAPGPGSSLRLSDHTGFDPADAPATAVDGRPAARSPAR